MCLNSFVLVTGRFCGLFEDLGNFFKVENFFGLFWSRKIFVGQFLGIGKN